jgi:hypothetical protein
MVGKQARDPKTILKWSLDFFIISRNYLMSVLKKHKKKIAEKSIKYVCQTCPYLKNQRLK